VALDLAVSLTGWLKIGTQTEAPSHMAKLLVGLAPIRCSSSSSASSVTFSPGNDPGVIPCSNLLQTSNGKSHMTYAQGASAELVAAGTIAAADVYGLPVSTTHVLSSGVAGTMAANGSGLQWSTVRNMLMAWVLTLPLAIMLSASLYVLFSNLL
jgi:hypothetical protein